MQRIAVLGSTGSIGRSTLDVVSGHRDRFEIVLLSAGSRSERLFAQAGDFSPKALVLAELEGSTELAGAPDGSRVFFGEEGLLQALEETQPELVVNAIMGAAGLRASAWTLRHGRKLLLANKESLVVAGPVLRALQKEHGGTILPIDSEHAAIHQCLRGERRSDLKRIWLTCSGGPFRDTPREKLAAVSVEEALAHPTWAMGARISIGSATLMNKAFEVLEAQQLFDLAAEEIEVIVHRQSIVHSMVDFRDGSIMAQLGVPDMRVPICYCLGHPERLDFAFEGFDPVKFAQLTFEEVDKERFPALELGYECIRRGGDSGAIVNAADEVATASFLAGDIPFPRITETIYEVLSRRSTRTVSSVEEVLDADSWARQEALRCLR
ncbi:MAG: 1-deoxy-D-xylulose-5-phosphate reductoisomerase [Planctomycetota bacterium]|nr:MAG: 1-deoxy-D-xylulose-5-phosphate reductoisomerase [Planctomycetota bacterium]